MKGPGDVVRPDLGVAFAERIGLEADGRDPEPLEDREGFALEAIVAVREPEHAGAHEERDIERQPLLQGAALPRRVVRVRAVGGARDA